VLDAVIIFEPRGSKPLRTMTTFVAMHPEPTNPDLGSWFNEPRVGRRAVC
jgi:hypothetical protein